MQNIIINGATSFIGKNLVKYYSNNNFFVYCVVRNVKKAKSLFYGQKNIKIINIKNQCNIKCNDFLYYFDLSWIGSSSCERSNINVQWKNINLIRKNYAIASKLNCKKYIYFGSIYEVEYMYYVNNNLNIPEKYIYGFFKNLCKEILFTIQKNTYVVWLRISNVYGPKENSNRFIWTVLNSKNKYFNVTKTNFIYDFIYIDDAIELIDIIAKNSNNLSIYNVCSDKPLYFFEYLKIIEKNKDIIFNKVNDNIPPQLLINDFKLDKFTNKHKFISFNDGINLTIKKNEEDN